MPESKTELNLNPVLVTIPKWLAKKKTLPMHFIGIVQKQTPKAYNIVGKGVMLKKAMGICSICGRTLSNPNSIKLGIGPICADRMGIPTLNGYTDADIEKHLHNIKIQDWFPKSYTKIDTDISNINAPNFDDIQKQVQTYQENKEYRYIEFKDGLIYIYFSFDREVLFNVKSIRGRKFDKFPKPHWTCPDTPSNRTDLLEFGFDFPPEPSKNKDKVKCKNGNGKRKCVPLHPPLPDHLDKALMPFQKEGVAFIFKKHGRALIGDEMGLGKTLQALTYMEIKSTKTVIICPASLKLTWAGEIAKWCRDYSITLCEGKKNKAKIKLVDNPEAKKEIYICNWDILGNKTKKSKGDKYPKDIPYTGWVDYLIDMNPDLVIGDEIHFAKNYKAIRARGFKRIGQRIEHLICLSGTPIENRPIEFYPTLNLLNGGVFNNWYKYTQRYCDAQDGDFGRDVSGASNIEELHSLVSTVMIRRLKVDVLPQLPKKVRVVIPLELSNEKTYQKAYNDFLSYVLETKGLKAVNKAKKAEHLVKIEQLKQLAYQGKKKAVIEWVKEYLETENKLVIFGIHKDVIKDLKDAFKDVSVVVDGNTPVNDRQAIADRFQTDPKIKLFIGGLKPASEGLTLTASKATAFVEYWWNSSKQDQAEDRVHRIGQEADSVTAYYLAAKNSIDEDMLEMLDKKRKIVTGILDGKSEEDVSLIDIMYNRHKK
jgi:SWI/SNF-related matrix-associated actin-dependent regulator 1 of chromatin subfamily A